jgi:KDO2-lipid IV(A) lauroyltransferase
MLSKPLYTVTYAGMWLLASLPFRVLYLLSDLLCLLMQHVAHYRRKVIRTNLRNSFPEKSRKELRRIEHRFYHYICDYMLEEIKMLRLSPEKMCRHMEYLHKEEFLRMIEQHGSIVLLIPHYANFEWIIGMGSFMKEGDLPVQIYKPLHDKNLDLLFQDIRSRFGGYNVPKHSMARSVIRLHNEGKRMAIGLITDQSPGAHEAHHWTTFLHQETGFMDGGERIARMMEFPVFYCNLQRVKRGYCKVSFDLITEHPKKTAEGEITEQFARRLEETIMREPAYWFWSHRRWKLTRNPEKRG